MGALSCSTGFSQELLLMQSDSSDLSFSRRKGMVRIHGEVHQQSNAVTNGFVDKFLLGGYIDNNLKDKQKLNQEDNTFSTGFHFGLDAFFAPDSLFGSDRYGWSISAGHMDDASARFTGDLFRAVFYGNKQFAGTAASLKNTGIRFQQYQHLSLGFFEKQTMSFVNVGVVSGNHFINTGLNDASFFTEETGDYVELYANGEVYFSDTSNTKTLAMNGLGAILNFEINIPFYINKRSALPSYLRFGGRHLGVTRWNKNSLHYSVDTTYRYSGFLIDDLASFDNVNDQVENIVDSLLPKSEHTSYTMTTPGWVYLSWFSPLSKSFFYELKVAAKVYSFHLPRATASLYFKPSSKWMVGANATYGGYGGYESASSFRAGVQLSSFISNHFMLNLQTNHLTGWLNKDATGRDFSFSILFLY